ncbi:MAG: Hsp20/alpha crystallin family protein [Candidatus Rokuibacteriota bacterium]
MQTAVTRWTPSDLFRPRFDRLFDQTFANFFEPVRGGEEVTNRGWLPPVDVRETEDALTLLVELPGIKREDVDITVEDRTLTVHGERKFEQDLERENYHRIERAYGTFTRTFTLPANVQADNVKATFADGVLTIELPKAEESKPRKIAIE